MSRFEPKETRGGWWVCDAYLQQWTPCTGAGEATTLAGELNTADAEGYDAIRIESMQWVRGTASDPGVDHATLLPPDATTLSSDSEEFG